MGSDKQVGKYQTARERMERLGLYVQYVKNLAQYSKLVGDRAQLEQARTRQTALSDVPQRRLTGWINQYNKAIGSYTPPMPDRPGPLQRVAGGLLKPLLSEEFMKNLPLPSMLPLAGTGLKQPSGQKVGDVPYVGEESARILSASTSPAALGVTALTLGAGAPAAPGIARLAAVSPRVLAGSTAGAITLGSVGLAAEDLGVPVAHLPGGIDIGPRGGLELFGGFYSGKGVPFIKSSEQKLIEGVQKAAAPKMAPQKLTTIVEKPAGGSQWGTADINLPEGWGITGTGRAARGQFGAVPARATISERGGRPLLSIDIGDLTGEATTVTKAGTPKRVASFPTRGATSQNMIDVVNGVYHTLAANPGYTARVTVVNDKLRKLMSRLGFKSVKTYNFGNEIVDTFEFTTDDLDRLIFKTQVPRFASGLVEEGGKPAERTVPEILRDVNAAYESSITAPGRFRQAVGREVWGTEREKSLLLQKVSHDEDLVKALQNAFINRAITPAQHAKLKAIFGDFPARVQGAPGRGIRLMENPPEVIVAPTQEEWRQMWLSKGYTFPEGVDVPAPTRENGFPFQPGLGQEPYQYGLAPGAEGTRPVNPTPELPGFERPATQGVLPEQQIPSVAPRYVEAGRQGYFPGMGSSLEYQPTLPGMETAPISDFAKRQIQDVDLTPRPLTGEQQLTLPELKTPEQAMQLAFPPPEALSPRVPLTANQTTALRIQHHLSQAMYNATEGNRTYANKLLKKVADGKLLNRVERNWFKTNLGMTEAAANELFPRGAGAVEELIGLANLPRAILASGDMSGTLRQAYLISLGHPDIMRKMVKAQWGSFWDESTAQHIEQELVHRTLRDGRNVAATATEAGLELPSWHSQSLGASKDFTAFQQQEEAFLLGRSRAAQFVEKAPILRGSNRAYVNGLNEARLSLFQKIVDGWTEGVQDIGLGPNDPIAGVFNKLLGGSNPSQWAKDPEALKALATFINHASGRGGLGMFSKAAPVLNAVFFAPRLTVSRFQTLGDLRHPAIRALVAKDIAQAYGTGASLMALLSLSGAGRATLDPRSADFGKLNVGNMHTDFFGGATPMIRLAAMMAFFNPESGEFEFLKSRTQAGELIDINPVDVVTHFLETKMAPVPGTITQTITGRDISGKKLDTSALGLADKLLIENITPLILQDVAQAFWEEGLINGLTSKPDALLDMKNWAEAAVAGPTAFIGVGTQIYPPSARTTFLEEFKKKYPDIDINDRTLVNLIASNDPKLSPLLERQRSEGLERGTEAGITFEENKQFFAGLEQEQHLPELANLVLGGKYDAGPRFLKAYQEYEDSVVAVLKKQFFGDAPTLHSELAKALDAYRSLTPVFDPLTGEEDMAGFFTRKDAARAEIARLPNGREVLNALDARLRTTSPETQRVERMYKDAAKQYHEVLGMKKYTIKGLSVEDEKEVDFLFKMAEQVRQQAALQGVQSLDRDTVWQIVAQANRGKIDPKLIGYAYNLSQADSFEVQNKDRREYLIDNFKTLYMFHPELYRSRRLLMMVGARLGRKNVPNDLLAAATEP